MEERPAEFYQEILLNLPYYEILSSCATNKLFASLCQSNHFWLLKIRKDFPEVIPPKKGNTRELYRIYYRERNPINAETFIQRLQPPDTNYWRSLLDNCYEFRQKLEVILTPLIQTRDTRLISAGLILIRHCLINYDHQRVAQIIDAEIEVGNLDLDVKRVLIQFLKDLGIPSTFLSEIVYHENEIEGLQLIKSLNLNFDNDLAQLILIRRLNQWSGRSAAYQRHQIQPFIQGFAPSQRKVLQRALEDLLNKG